MVLFGLGGSGRTELLECLYGTRPCSGGAVILDGTPQRTPSPVASLKNEGLTSRQLLALCYQS